jgi:hypothetical protein
LNDASLTYYKVEYARSERYKCDSAKQPTLAFQWYASGNDEARIHNAACREFRLPSQARYGVQPYEIKPQLD